MKTTLRLMLPRLAELRPEAEIGFVLLEGSRLRREGALPLRSLAAAVPAVAIEAILHPADAVIAEVTLPPLPAHQLALAATHAVEPLVLSDIERLAIGFSARSAQGRVDVAWADRDTLASAWQKLVDHQLLAQALIPAPLTLPIPERGVILACQDHHLLARDAQGRGYVLALDPLADDAPDPGTILWLEQRLASEPQLTWIQPVPAAWQGWHPDLPQGLPADDAGLFERLPDLPAEHRWLGPAPGWSLAVASIRPRRLQGSAWRKPILWSTAAAAIWLLGLNLYAWQLQREAQAIERHMTAQVQAAFPQLPVVLDPLRQATQQRDALRHAGGDDNAGDFFPLALAAAELLPGSAQAVQSLNYQDGILQLRLTGQSTEAPSSALDAALMARAQQLGLQIEEQGGVWQIQTLDAAGAAGDQVSITPGVSTRQRLDQTTGGSR